MLIYNYFMLKKVQNVNRFTNSLNRDFSINIQQDKYMVLFGRSSM